METQNFLNALHTQIKAISQTTSMVSPFNRTHVDNAVAENPVECRTPEVTAFMKHPAVQEMLQIYLPMLQKDKRHNYGGLGEGSGVAVSVPPGRNATPMVVSPPFVRTTSNHAVASSSSGGGTPFGAGTGQSVLSMMGNAGVVSPPLTSPSAPPSTSVPAVVEVPTELQRAAFADSIFNVGMRPGPSSQALQYTPVGAEDSPNHRRNFMRRQRMEYLRNLQNQGAEGGKTHIPTDAEGNVTALRSVLNRTIRGIVGRILDVSLKEFRQHPSSSFILIEHDIHNQFSFDPPLKSGYIKDYLQDALSWTRYQWRSHWTKTKERHPQCPIKRYPAVVAQWVSERGVIESKKMSRVRMHRRRPGNVQASGGAISHGSGEERHDLHNDQVIIATSLLRVSVNST